MPPEYRLDLHSAAGVKFAEVTDFNNLEYLKPVNAPGLLSFQLPGDHSAIASLEDKSEIILYRKNDELSLSWTADFYGLYRKLQWQYQDKEIFRAYCPGLMTMLGWRIVAWKAATANRSDFSAVVAETVMKTLVNYNAGSSATTGNGRIRTGTITGISSAADAAGGNTISIGCAYQNLLETLQKVAAIGGGDFDMIRTGSATWQFRFYTGQRGTDQSATLLFSLERGNMAKPIYSLDKSEAGTIAIVGGQGEGSSRTTVVRTETGNEQEFFVDARDLTTTAGLNSRGDTELYERRVSESFTFDVLQIPSCYYGLHYQVGDLITARYKTTNVVMKILSANVRFDESGESISVEMAVV